MINPYIGHPNVIVWIQLRRVDPRMLPKGLLLALSCPNLSANRLEIPQIGLRWPFQRSSRQPTPASGLLRFAVLDNLDSCLTILTPSSVIDELV